MALSEAAVLLFGEGPEPGSKKGAIVRRIKRFSEDGVLFFFDETILRLFPVLRRSWSPQGEQARVPMTGRNAQRVLYGGINRRTGRRLVSTYPALTQRFDPDYRGVLRRAYPGKKIVLLLDQAPSPLAQSSLPLAADYEMELLWLPQQCPELNGRDHLGGKAKTAVAANYPFASVDELAKRFIDWVKPLSPRRAKLLAGILSPQCWLKQLL
jgi:DDE superfamily endonuclease